MFFFDDFLKKVDRTRIEFKSVRRYTLEAKRLIMLIGTGIPLILIGLLQMYIGYTTKGFSIPYVGVAILLLFLGFKHFKKILMYRVILDCEKKKILGQGLNLAFDEIDSCTLKEGVVGKGNRLQALVRIVTKDKREIIVPLIMGNKIDFICTLRDELKEKFSIIKG